MCCFPAPLSIQSYIQTKQEKEFITMPNINHIIPQPLISFYSAKETMSHDGHHNMAGMSDDMPGTGSENMPGMGGDLRNTTQMSMHQSLYWGKKAIVLFNSWPGQSLGMLLLAFIFVFILATAAEVLSVSPVVKAGTSPTKAGAVQASIYAFRIGFAYLVMLSVMSFNIGIFAAAVAGHTLGYFLIKARAQALANQAEPKV